MKNAAYSAIIIFVLLATLVTAAAPTLVSQVELNGSTGIYARMHSIDSEHLIIFDQTSSSSCRLRIVNPTTGQVTDSTSIQCTYPIDAHYDAGTIATCSTYFLGGTGWFQKISVYKWPDEGFLQLKGSWTSSCSGSCSAFFGGCKIDSSSSTSADIFVNNFDYPAASDRDGVAKIWFNGSAPTFTDYPIIVPSSFNLLNDESNDVFGTSNDFYDNSDPFNHTGKILDSLLLGDVLRAWNYDSSSPEWVSANGFIVLADDYSDVTESSGAVTMDDIMAYGGRDEILGLIDGWWYNGDFSITPGAPTLTNTSVYMTNYDPSPSTGGAGTFEFLTTNTNIYYYNETNDVLSTWEYQAAPTCSYLDGCYMDEPFVYSDSVLNHGWTGWSVSPDNGQLECFGSTQYNTYQFTPITSQTGTFTLEFDARICGDTLSYLNVWIADGSNVALQLWFKGDSIQGSIQDHNWNYLTHDLGEVVADPGNITCSGFQMFENNYKIVIHPQNIPKTYDLYINDILESPNNRWTTIGEQMSQVSYVYFGGGFVPPYCFWAVDNIKISTPPVAELDEETISEERATLGGLDLRFDQRFSFDRDALCAPTENTQLCFLKVIIGGLLGWLWRLIVNNPLSSLAAVLVLIVIIVTGYKMKE